MSPDRILFAQHGWADTNRAIAQFAKALATPKTLVIAPNLGYLKTWLWIEPLIEQVARVAIETVASYPDAPIRIVGHSMGGLIWLEVLDRYPQLRSKIESLVLVASPIGGADLARAIDPLGIGIGIARDLGINRRAIAQRIATEIPTLVIAGDIDNGSDGTIAIETTKFDPVKFICLKGISHAALKNHLPLVDIIRDFWANPLVNVSPEPDFSNLLIQRLQSLPGMTDAHPRDFWRSKTYITFNNGITIRTWTNLLQVQHIYVADREDNCLYSGFVGWLHDGALSEILAEIQKECDVDDSHQ
jgi:pimeloyl-ACP methyl ester carboxylesterase